MWIAILICCLICGLDVVCYAVVSLIAMFAGGWGRVSGFRWVGCDFVGYACWLVID